MALKFGLSLINNFRGGEESYVNYRRIIDFILNPPGIFISSSLVLQLALRNPTVLLKFVPTSTRNAMFYTEKEVWFYMRYRTKYQSQTWLGAPARATI